jgi:hypothetical protein
VPLVVGEGADEDFHHRKEHEHGEENGDRADRRDDESVAAAPALSGKAPAAEKEERACDDERSDPHPLLPRPGRTENHAEPIGVPSVQTDSEALGKKIDEARKTAERKPKGLALVLTRPEGDKQGGEQRQRERQQPPSAGKREGRRRAGLAERVGDCPVKDIQSRLLDHVPRQEEIGGKPRDRDRARGAVHEPGLASTKLRGSQRGWFLTSSVQRLRSALRTSLEPYLAKSY